MKLAYFESISAGFPSPAKDDTKIELDLNTYLIDHPSSSFLVKVKWDSMIGACIADGDIVLVDKSRKHKIGDIVVAQIDREFTLKYYMVDGKGTPFLQADNLNYPPMYAEEELVVFGVVSSVIRKYNL